MCLAQFSGLLDFNIHFCSLKEGFFPRGLLTHRSCASQVFSCGSFVYIDLIDDSFFFFSFPQSCSISPWPMISKSGGATVCHPARDGRIRH